MGLRDWLQSSNSSKSSESLQGLSSFASGSAPKIPEASRFNENLLMLMIRKLKTQTNLSCV